ncbi:DUF881 domain-containing protein [Lederbergia citrea]|uniref:DUF881 domain-containing protein n=1 Tax=Lederbergia citrea TaxID=2833581 RepID=A0A942UMB3_9BACI|nr:DUF881 domain-containing protein [Lederbergia citrea]MBS4177206.1 DUF881 domain-containing protein [Lederbergia citrea]MBS4203869.1 DUF881 domain-containing protein [Lederbergia citrea]MBS4221546.1 DUF881 domain-containing protein [Lederbergia citrea]
MKKRMKGKYVIFSFVFLVFGFILAFSYSQSGKEARMATNITDKQYLMENNLRKELILTQDRNRDLQRELYDKQEKVRQFEKELSQEEKIYFNLAEDAERYRMFLGKVKVQGSGIEVSLEDGEYKQSEDANNYLVHEHHVFKVVNELFIAGASAVAINGQRLNHDSYIICNGPVITVDGNPFPAPFKITAIGDTDILLSALTLTGGVRDQLVNDNIIFTVVKKKQIILDPVLGESS